MMVYIDIAEQQGLDPFSHVPAHAGKHTVVFAVSDIFIT